MAKVTHINVTVDVSKISHKQEYDLRIPVQLNVKQLLQHLSEALHIDDNTDTNSRSVIKIVNKNLLIVDDDYLVDFPITDGDVLLIL